jgi:hypothetical protein
MIEGHQRLFRVFRAFRGSTVRAASPNRADIPIHLPESRLLLTDGSSVAIEAPGAQNGSSASVTESAFLLTDIR